MMYTLNKCQDLSNYIISVEELPHRGNLPGKSGKSFKLKFTPLMTYDSTTDTLKHIRRVNQLLIHAAEDFLQRAIAHDDSKLYGIEKEGFDKYTPLLKDTTYGSPEYKECLKGLGEALQAHYSRHSHHPEHYSNGVDGMNLFDILEMLLDWKAASERHDDGDIFRSIEHNTTRFKLSPQLKNILINTANYLHFKGKDNG